MTVSPRGTTLCRQLGTMNIPINDAPYTISATIAQNCPITNNGLFFAQGSPWPLLWNFKVFEASPTQFFFLVKQNAAIPGTLAPTLIASGIQDGARGQYGPGPGQNQIKYAPCYYGGYLGRCSGFFASKFEFTSTPSPPGVGSIAFPYQNLVTTVDSTSPVSSQTMVCNYQGATCFCICYENGAASQAKFLIWSLGGIFVAEIFTTAGPFSFPIGNTLADTQPWIIQPFSGPGGVANVAMAGRSPGTGNLRPIIFLDANMQVLYMQLIQIDNPTIQAEWSNFADGATVNCQVAAGGWIWSWKIGAAPFRFIFMSGDGSYWCPINLNRLGAQAQKQIPTYLSTTLHIDPTGVAWMADWLSTDSTKIYIGSSFGASFQLPMPPPYNMQNIPPFSLNCFTPCDIVSAK